MNQITGITFGSGDNDTYSYDANSGHMTGFSFHVNGQSLTAVIGWNPNGTVMAFSTTDPFNTANNGICNFGYDDMVRVSSASCAPTGGPAYWSQIFSFDPFGNISKSGSSAFQPTYSSTTNRITSLPGATISYDANGNLLNDDTYTYDWTAFGKASTVNGISMPRRGIAGCTVALRLYPTRFPGTYVPGYRRAAALRLPARPARLQSEHSSGGSGTITAQCR